jgi:hypothetical protein
VSRLSRGGAPPQSDGPPRRARGGEPETDAPSKPVASLNSRPVAGLQDIEAVAWLSANAEPPPPSPPSPQAPAPERQP